MTAEELFLKEAFEMVQAEQSVIGCLMMAPGTAGQGARGAFPAMFEAQPLAHLSCMLELKKAGTPVDAVTVVSGWGTAMRPLSGVRVHRARIGTFPQYAAHRAGRVAGAHAGDGLQSLAISGRTAG